MAGTKRRNVSSSHTSRKRARKSPVKANANVEPEKTSVHDNDDDDDLQSILAQIRKQEENEASQPAAEQNGRVEVTGSSTHSTKTSNAPGESGLEDDEAMAKRLSLEWAEQNRNWSLSEGSALPAKSTASAVVGASAPPDKELENFRKLFTAERKCSKCGSIVKSPRGNVAFPITSPPPSLLSLLHAPCSSCRTNHCRGCFTPTPCPASCKGNPRSKTRRCPVETCCTEIRAIALFEILGGLDRQYNSELAKSKSRVQAAGKMKANNLRSVGPGGTGYGLEDTTPYNPTPHGESKGKSQSKGGQSSKNRGQDPSDSLTHWEETIARAFNLLASFLPAPYVGEPQVYDMLPHPSIGPLLSLSHFPEILGDLLRNDSVTDWIARSEIYYAMISLLRRMADCELTVEVLIGPRWEKNKSCGIEEWMWGDGDITWEKGDGKEARARASPLYEYFRKLTKQCEAFLAGVSQLLDCTDADDEDMMIKATSLCGDIIAARDDVERAMIVLGGPRTEVSKDRNKVKGKDRDPSIEMEKAYSLACEKLAFKHVSFVSPSATTGYYYASQLTQTSTATRTPKDRLHLIKELAVMATSLPPGVWVRVDEVRNDAIKIMIAGPEGTPYAGGLFQFDCFMPLTYPNTPPLVYLVTTGGGRVRFNPNLYSNGKVCLSLLGTWPGRPEEQWSNKSTLLQVLVSIQSMILIDTPYFNEPGYGTADPNNESSIDYNKEICVQTVRWAMVEWLKKEHHDGIWRDVIASHFSIRKDNIQKRIREWAKLDPRIYKYSPSITGLSALPNAEPPIYHQHGVGANSALSQKPGSGYTNLLEEFERGVCELKDDWRT